MQPTNWMAEIEDLHAFFCGWFGGDLPADDDTFARCVDTMAPGFTIVGPAGVLTEREPLLAWLRRAHGSRPGLRIWIVNAALRRRHGPLTLVTYEEWQRFEGRTSARLSSALFEDDPAAPHGLRWLHVHETWLPSERADA